MKQISILLAVCAIAILIGYELVQADPAIQKVITVETPGKKSGGNPTKVVFQHQRHVSEFDGSCETCHPPIAERIGDPANNQQNVHATCRKCHAKNKPGKSFACAKCHVR